MIASKFDEIDDKLVFVSDVQGYLKTTQFAKVMPMWKDVVETERHIMRFFDWSIWFSLPIHFVETFLSQGVLFSDEVNNFDDDDTHQEIAKQIAQKCYYYLDEFAKKRESLKNMKGWQPSQVACIIVFKARQDVLGTQKWPTQLQIITRASN